MYFVEVLVGSVRYHGSGALTYNTEQQVIVGAVVGVALRNQTVLGIVTKHVSKPTFATKPIDEILPLNPLPPQTVGLIRWIEAYYPAPLGAIVQLFLPKVLSKKHLNYSGDGTPSNIKTPPALTAEQKAAIAQIIDSGTHILHGTTGSGKTRVYIELAKRALLQNRSAIVLTPEIGLTSQLVQSFQQVFGNKVVLIHSQLTDTERQKTWIQVIQSKEPLIVIGARSALFSPLANIGMIIIDEAHETAYKQEQAPHYVTSRVAAKLGQLYDCPVVLGSATPLVSDYFLAEQKQRPIIRMQQLATGDNSHETSIEVVDLKDRTQFSRRPYLSNSLLTEIEATLSRSEQVLLFLNRRGTARVIFCEQCAWQADCPHCDVPLVYHGDDHTMRCHTCNHTKRAIASCPECQNTAIVFKSIGTKAIADDVKALFPHTPVMRFDTDNKKGDRIEQHYSSVKNGDVGIIVGTQTLAKGLDLPKLGLVGVILADTSLYVPDYNAEERTYQLLVQVLGRIGRGHRSSKAVVQTYHPKSAILQAILKKDWASFYQKEIEERKLFLFPPFCYVLKLSCRRATQVSAQKASEQLAKTLRSQGRRIVVEGPAPAFHEKFAGKYQWQLIVKAKQRTELTAIIKQLPSGWTYDIDPINLL